jgi:hypothetical protein
LLFPPAWRNRTGRTSSALRDGIDCVLNGFGKTPLAGKLPSFPLGSKPVSLESRLPLRGRSR